MLHFFTRKCLPNMRHSKISKNLCIIMLFSYTQFITVYAANWQRVTSEVNQIHLIGTCTDKKEVTVYLFASSSTNIIYNAGAQCIKGTFDYTDDLMRWGLPLDTYRMVVAEGQAAGNFNHVEEVILALPVARPEVPADPNLVFQNKAGNVSNSLQVMSQSVNDMLQSLGDTTYPAPLKFALSGVLTSIKGTLTGLADIVLHMQNLIYGIEQTFNFSPTPTPSSTTIVPAIVPSSDTTSTTTPSDSASTDQAEASTTPEVVPPVIAPPDTTPSESTSAVLGTSTTQLTPDPVPVVTPTDTIPSDTPTQSPVVEPTSPAETVTPADTTTTDTTSAQ